MHVYTDMYVYMTYNLMPDPHLYVLSIRKLNLDAYQEVYTAAKNRSSNAQFFSLHESYLPITQSLFSS